MTNTLRAFFISITIAALFNIASNVYAHSSNETLPPTQPAHPDYCSGAIPPFLLFVCLATQPTTTSTVPEPTPGTVFYFDDWNTGSDYQVPKH